MLTFLEPKIKKINFWNKPESIIKKTLLLLNKILNNKPIKVFNHGKMERDFTYINDIVEGVCRVIESNVDKREKYKIYNIGNNNSIKLMDFIECIESSLNKISQKEMMPMQKGDVKKTWADVSRLINDYNYKPTTKIENGVQEFINWYIDYNKLTKF